jgi:phosphohistidine phosphatase SixA
MFLYLVQHAEAKREEEDPAGDLTDKGRADFEAVARHLKRLNLQVKQIIHSGKTRAESTALALAKHLQPRAWRPWMTRRLGQNGSRRWISISCWWSISPISAGWRPSS